MEYIRTKRGARALVEEATDILLTEEDVMVGFSGGVGRAEAAVDPSPLWMIGLCLREMTTTACSRYNTSTFAKQS